MKVQNGLFKNASVLLLLFMGCGGADTATVSGVAKYENQPIPTGTKVFFELPGTGYVAAAKVDETGTFKLAHKGSVRIRPGEYSIYVGPPESNLTQNEYFELKKKVDAEFRKKGKKPPPSPDWVLPQKYYSPNTTTLRKAIVVGENEVEILLED
ncbi:MAG: hypothetical protein AAF497_18065 [Planctomycetota bacterium]